jgi:hypothetical protein
VKRKASDDQPSFVRRETVAILLVILIGLVVVLIMLVGLDIAARLMG